MKITLNDFLATLNDKELHDVKTFFARNKEWYAAQSEDEIIQVLIFNILWNYKALMDDCRDMQQAREYAKRKVQVYQEWKKLGLVE
ncbi:hypothetical protein [Acidaminococcus timonensis]|uniref:hypothetical protein n=1 Tax=Acidaminococcus timonensis TaxID=1871002 RepID=UPI0026F37640|nr:hypothetical protein [Acidaminococcus timonensis]